MVAALPFYIAFMSYAFGFLALFPCWVLHNSFVVRDWSASGAEWLPSLSTCPRYLLRASASLSRCSVRVTTSRSTFVRSFTHALDKSAHRLPHSSRCSVTVFSSDFNDLSLSIWSIPISDKVWILFWAEVSSFSSVRLNCSRL